MSTQAGPTPTQPSPQQQQPQQQQSTPSGPALNQTSVSSPAPNPSASPSPWDMSPQESKQYESLFSAADLDGDQYVSGNEALTFFTKSGLSQQQLVQIWKMSDLDSDSKLNLKEFKIAIHLIMKVKQGLSLPQTLPPSLDFRQAAAAVNVNNSSGPLTQPNMGVNMNNQPNQPSSANLSSSQSGGSLPVPTPAEKPVAKSMNMSSLMDDLLPTNSGPSLSLSLSMNDEPSPAKAAPAPNNNNNINNQAKTAPEQRRLSLQRPPQVPQANVNQQPAPRGGSRAHSRRTSINFNNTGLSLDAGSSGGIGGNMSNMSPSMTGIGGLNVGMGSLNLNKKQSPSPSLMNNNNNMFSNQNQNQNRTQPQDMNAHLERQRVLQQEKDNLTQQVQATSQQNAQIANNLSNASQALSVLENEVSTLKASLQSIEMQKHQAEASIIEQQVI